MCFPRRLFTDILQENEAGAGWVVGTQVTFADIVIFNYCEELTLA